MSPTVFIVDNQNDTDSDTLRREMNKKYFNNDNPTYRHSTEFKRLLSTSSGSSSERHSAVPIGEYL